MNGYFRVPVKPGTTTPLTRLTKKLGYLILVTTIEVERQCKYLMSLLMRRCRSIYNPTLVRTLHGHHRDHRVVIHIPRADVFRFGDANGASPVFEGLEWTVNEGENWAVVGSGCGQKTALLQVRQISSSKLVPNVSGHQNEGHYVFAESLNSLLDAPGTSSYISLTPYGFISFPLPRCFRAMARPINPSFYGLLCTSTKIIWGCLL